MQYLGIELQKLIRDGALHTAREISQQPALWQKIWDQLYVESPTIISFLDSTKDVKRIILTGAGTSAYIGISLRGVFQRRTGMLTEAISNTDLVSHPRDYFHPHVPTLLISFARSGNSPESTAAAAIADEICETCYHLIITCNQDGKLARFSSKNKKYVFTLPLEANDQSLAMTSSYSGMLLTGKLIAHIRDMAATESSLFTIMTYGEKIINQLAGDIKKIAQLDFKRVVFLGGGPLFGTATEAQLKLQELTDGKIICKVDSFLGFRHGPKAVIDRTTLVVYIFSNNEYVSQYEKDLVFSMKTGNLPLAEVGIMESSKLNVNLHQALAFSENGSMVDEEFLAVCSVVPAQMLGFFKSLQLGLRPDSPSETGAITRVVEGVQIYAIP